MEENKEKIKGIYFAVYYVYVYISFVNDDVIKKRSNKKER